MKLKSFNPETLPVSSKGKPAMYINSKAGMFHISATAAEKLELKEGDSIELHQDEEQPQDWYLSKTKKGFGLRNKKKGSDEQGLNFNNTALAKLIFESVGYKAQTGRVLFGAEPTVIKSVAYWPVITANLFKSK